MKKVITLLLALLLLSTTFGNVVNAEQTPSADIILGNFENGQTDGWVAGDDTGSVISTMQDIASGSGINPEYAAQGGFFLQVAKAAVPATTKSYVVKNFSSPLDLSTFKYINYDFFGWAGTSTTYSIDLVLTATDSSTQTFTVQCVPGVWMGNNIDISSFAGRGIISSIKLAYYGNDLAHFAGGWTGCFNIDGINASNSITNPTGVPTALPKQIISDFETDVNGWVKDANTYEVAKNGFSNNSNCLEVTKAGIAPTIPSYVSKTYAVGSELNLSNSNIISFDVSCWGGAAEKYGFYLVLNSKSGSSIKLKEYGEANSWNTLVFDISGFANRDSISSIQIGFFCDGNIVPAAQGGWAGHCFIDNITAYASVGRLYDFEYGSANGWSVGNNIYPNSFGSSPGVAPYPTKGSNGQSFLMGQKTGTPDTVSSMLKNFSDPLDLSNFGALTFDFFNHGGASLTETYQVELVLTSSTSSKTYSSVVNPNAWRKLQFNITDFAERNTVTQIKINFYTLNANPAVGEWNGAFFVDNFCAVGVIANSIKGTIITSLTNYDNGLDGWQAGANTNSTSDPIKVDTKGYDWGGTTGCLPTGPSQGTQLLRAVKTGIANVPSYVVKNYKNLLDLSSCTTLNYDMFCYGGASTSYITKLILTSASGTAQTFTTPIATDSWITISTDISGFSELQTISSIQIGYCGTDTAVTGDADWGGQYYLDNINLTGTYNYSAADLVTFGAYNKSVSNRLTNIAPGTTVLSFKGAIFKADKASLSIKNIDGVPLADENSVGTGTVIEVKVSGFTIESYKIVIYGDVNGDGAISVPDLIAVKQHLLKSKTLADEKLLAGDVSKNGTISISDLLAVKKQIVNNVTISQS